MHVQLHAIFVKLAQWHQQNKIKVIEWKYGSSLSSCLDGKGLRKMSIGFIMQMTDNVPVEMLRRRVNGFIGLGCKPEPAIYYSYWWAKGLKDFLMWVYYQNSRLTKEDLAEKIQCKHPFKVGKANCGWFDSFKLWSAKVDKIGQKILNR